VELYKERKVPLKVLKYETISWKGVRMKDEERYKAAKERVEEIKGFYVHLFIYIVVNIGLVVLDVLTSPYNLWFYWPLFGWGIGIAAHAVSVFGIKGILGKDWEERKIKELMDREKKTEKSAKKTEPQKKQVK
jgi:hypothetical protein